MTTWITPSTARSTTPLWLPAIAFASRSGRKKKSPTPTTRVRPSISATAPFPSSALSTGAGDGAAGPGAVGDALASGAPRRADQPAGSHDQGLVEDDQPADEREARPARGAESHGQLLVRPDDAPVRMAERHRDRVAPAHEHTLDEGLAAVGETSHRVTLPARTHDGGPPWRRRSSRQRPVAARSRRFWNRSTWPAVSMIICLPV